jgi:PTS system galactitol-specific IIB component
MKRILLCCGTGIATSTLINHKIEEELIKRGYKGEFTIEQCKLAEAPARSVNFDFCISTVPSTLKFACPLILATNLLLNRNVEEIYAQIEEELKK